MIVSPSDLAETIMIGNDAGWLLRFYREHAQGVVEQKPVLEIGRHQYNAQIRGTLPAGLEGGVYTFVVEGLSDDEYRTIKPRDISVVRLYLFWNDANADVGAYLANVAGLTGLLGNTGPALDTWLVAELRVLSVSRRAGPRHYETTIEARERVYENLATRVVCPPTPGGAAETYRDILSAAEQLARDHHVPVQVHRGGQDWREDERQIETGQPALNAMRELGRQMEQKSGKYGRGMFLIRNGMLNVGLRDFPLSGAVRQLTPQVGLITLEALQPLATDPNFNPCNGQPRPERRQFKLTLKGRPDLKPGDVVAFRLPEEEDVRTIGQALSDVIGSLDGGLLPSLDGAIDEQQKVQLYVALVEHRLGRTSGFVTIITGVELVDLAQPWDMHTLTHTREEQRHDTGATGEQRAVDALDRRIGQALHARKLAEVGEVRQIVSSTGSDVPSQTLRVWLGLAPTESGPFGARRHPIQQPSPLPWRGVPYVSPFAWGKCGLVLPRYPGVRALFVHRNGQSDDPVEVGSLWNSGSGPDAKPGDWWLILPVGVPANRRDTIADNVVPAEHTGKVSQDLIDADGNRVIEVGEMTIRVGRDKLKDAGQRPERGEQNAVTIEHAGGESKIVMKADGTVTITAKKLELVADKIDLDARNGDITMKAATVNVQVSGSMDVSELK